MILERAVQKFLFLGPDVLVAAHMAAFASLTSSNFAGLVLTDYDFQSAEQIRAFIREIVQEIHPENAPQKDLNNLVVMAASPNDPDASASFIKGFEADQVWYAAVPSADLRAGLDFLFEILSASRITCVNVAVPSFSQPAAETMQFLAPETRVSNYMQQEFERKLAEQCKSNGVSCKLFHLPLLLGRPLLSSLSLGHPLLLFLAELHRLKWEVEARFSDYFEYQSLRCQAPADAHLNIMHFREAAEVLLTIASDPDFQAADYQIASRKTVAFDQFCEWVNRAYDLNLFVGEPEEMNAIDCMFSEKVTALSIFCSRQAQPRKDGNQVLGASGFENEDFGVAVLKSIRQRQSEEADRKLARASALPGELRRQAVMVDGSELIYFTAGSQGSPIVILNALGQGLKYWHRLISELSSEHKVIIWELRGTTQGPQPFLLPEQVKDLEAIFAQERMESCHLIAWCTGPKLALEFYLQRPGAVASMVFLNACFRGPTTPPNLLTEYESHVDPLFRTLDSRPRMAAAVMNGLRQSAADTKLPSPSETDGKDLATRVLALISSDLQPEVVRPFESETSTLNYARQVLDFYSREIALQASNVDVPVLAIGAEYDKVTSPELSRIVATAFPRGQYVELRGGTHYCLYDQAERVFDLIHVFFEEQKIPASSGTSTQLLPASS
jgi:pimeloyl-ACP methyl ester carboxylesterase